MKPKLFILILLLFAFSACNEKEKHSEERSMNDRGDETELKKAVLSKGDVEAYESLRITYLDHPFTEEFLSYALIMANKYNYQQAYFDVFMCLTDIYWGKLSDIDETTATLAIDYLLKASEKGHDQAKEMVEEFSVKMNPGHNRAQIEQIFKE